VLIGGVLLILGVALGLTGYLVDAQIPAQLVEWAADSIESPLVFLLCLNIFLLIVGCVMDIFSATVVVVPLIVPLGQAFGIDPVHFGVIMVLNLMIGLLTPPIGLVLYVLAKVTDIPFDVCMRATLPFLVPLVVVLLLVTFR